MFWFGFLAGRPRWYLSSQLVVEPTAPALEGKGKSWCCVYSGDNMFIMRPWGEWGMVLPVAFSLVVLVGLTVKAAKATLSLCIGATGWTLQRCSALRKAEIAFQGEGSMLIGLVNTLALHCPWFSGVHIPGPNFPRMIGIWRREKQNNPQQPNTLAVAHVDSACQFSQSRFPTQITDCWIWRTPCVCVHTCA